MDANTCQRLNTSRSFEKLLQIETINQFIIMMMMYLDQGI